MMDIDATSVPANPLVTGQNFYGLGIDGNELYVTNNNAFQGNGTVLVYDLNGSEKYNFPTGRGPNAVMAIPR
jgi:hypothetical protein